METHHLPSHRLVGELSHSIELLLHLVSSSALTTPTGEKIPHFSKNNGPRSTEAQQMIRSITSSLRHCSRRRGANVGNYIFSMDFSSPTTSTSVPRSAQGCWTAMGTWAERDSTVTCSRYATVHCGKCS